VLFIFSLVLGACGGPARAANEVIYWTSNTGTIDAQAQQEIVDAFNKSQSQYHVRMVKVPGGISNLAPLVTAVRSGTGPDVYLLDRFTVSQFAALGLLQEIDAYVAKEGKDISSLYLPFAWQETQFQGHTYALPMETDARVLFYNKDMLTAAGIDLALMDPANGPLTIDKFKEIALKINHRESNGGFDKLGTIPWGGQASPVTWGMNYGATFIDKKTCQITPTEPGMQKAMQLLADWIKDESYADVTAFTDTYQPANAPPTQNPFYTSNLAMLISGDWELSGFAKYAPKLNWGMTYIPTPDGKTPFTWSGGFSVVMPTNANNPNGAYSFMRFMAGTEGQRIYTQKTAHMPTYNELLKDESLFDKNHQFFTAMLSYSHSRPPLPVWSQLWGEFSDASDKVKLGTAPDPALQSVYNRVQPQLQQYCPL
jgi:ABC-type glycerol-3-phosphate transport system substrate-binding protein